MPDDPSLDAYRSEFAGMLGMIEERPNDKDEGGTSLPGVVEVTSTRNLLERLDRSPMDRVDAQAFLIARLVDLFLGDWDRHRGQWRWGRRTKDAAWEPIPNDRDQALARFDGLLLSAARQRSAPQLTNFSGSTGSGENGLWTATPGYKWRQPPPGRP